MITRGPKALSFSSLDEQGGHAPASSFACKLYILANLHLMCKTPGAKSRSAPPRTDQATSFQL